MQHPDRFRLADRLRHGPYGPLVPQMRRQPACAARVRLLYRAVVTLLRIAEVARLLRVSDDTVRRWMDAGRLAASTDGGGRRAVAGAELARFVRANREEGGEDSWPVSARNKLEGIVTEVRRDGLVALVEIQAGPFRLLSMMTADAVDELDLQPGSLASAVVKSTNVIVEATPAKTG